MRSAPAALVLMLAAPALAQETAPPLLELDFPETEAIPGQPLSLRLTVLVPTFMPKPVEFPSFETPNVRVRLPERATGPVSRRVGADTWSGVSRHYLVTPMVAGAFSVPPQDVAVTYEVGGAARTVVMKTDPVAFRGVVPPGGEGLDPFVAATDLALKQEVTGDPPAMAPGAGVERTVTATIAGASPMVLPPLLPPHEIPGVAAYPDAPAVAEAEERGVLSGTRTETVTLMAESGGSGRAPDVALDWYDLDTRRVATARVEGFDVHVDAPPAPAGDERPLIGIALPLAVLGALILLAALLAARVQRRVEVWRRRWRASEAFAFARLRDRIAARDYPATVAALDAWAARRGGDPHADAAIRTALERIGAARYGQHAGDAADAWTALATALYALRKAAPAARRVVLPPLNPARPPA